MYSIWKFNVSPGSFTALMPENSKVLSVQTQGGVPVMWCLVDTEEEKLLRQFITYGTGHEIKNPENQEFIGTFQIDGGNLIFHLFEIRGDSK